MKSLTVVGGGVTGLAAAFIAARSGVQVRVLEGSSEFGGLLRTFEIAGTRLEHFYHHFFTHDAEIHWLLKLLELEDAIIYRDSTMGVLRNGKAYSFSSPTDLLSFAPMRLPAKL